MAKDAEMKKWKDLAINELRGKPLESLDWNTAEGIPVKPIYTAADLEGMEHMNTLPGLEPYVRGPRATMYAVRPWTIRMIGATGGTGAGVQTAFLAARRAAILCQGNGYDLPPEKYPHWKDIEMTFNPDSMRLR